MVRSKGLRDKPTHHSPPFLKGELMMNKWMLQLLMIHKKSIAAWTGFGIGLALLIGCGDSTPKDIPASNAAASTAPAITTEETPAVSKEDNPFAAAGIDDPKAFIKMFEVAKTAVAAGDKEAVAELVLFPLRVNAETSREVTSKEAFIAQYDTIITDPVKAALAKQKVDELFVRDQGVMVGAGEIWFGASADEPQDYGIIAVNLNAAASRE
jgi:hypothetical protein